MNKLYTALLVPVITLLLIGTFRREVRAQDLPPIATDRPDQTESPYITPAGYIQVETGFQMENDRMEMLGEKTKTWSALYPTVLSKYGFNERCELRLITEYAAQGVGDEREEGAQPLIIGFKSRLLDEKGLLPMVSVICHLTTPFLAGKGFKPTYYAPSFRFLLQHSVSERVSIGYNLGAEWDGETAEPTFIYTFTTAISLSDRIGCYVEAFGFAPQLGRAMHQADGGFTYLFSDNAQLDISGGIALTDNAPDYYTSLGFSFRLPVRK